MLLYSSEKFIRAHQDVSKRYYNYSYDRYVRDAICNKCGAVIGEQERFPDFDNHNHFRFAEDEKNKFKFCPYCGEKF
jgi:hypothetical protein